ncbi:glycolate oxidase subunit GlcE [Comamonadaceae bacterium M7527]|nr:glycolate oxidase subunit GlcE [Comamonadaceae bacterium M7527]
MQALTPTDSSNATPAAPAQQQAQAVQALGQRIRAANDARHVLRVRGGGSKDFYGQPLRGEVLDTSALNHVLSYEPTELVITVGAGMKLDALTQLLAEQQQCLPCDPPLFGGATVGGMVASALSGPARASVGGVKDFVLGIEMLDGAGQALRFGGQVMKNVAGYDMSRLMVGSLGTLGVLTEVSLKVLPIATAQATLKLVCTQEQALTMLNKWGGQPLPLNASTWLAESGQGALYVRLRGAKAAVDTACQTMAAGAAGDGATCTQLDAEQADALWTSWREQSHDFFKPKSSTHCLWRLSVAQTAPVIGLSSDTLVEWHGAQRWVWAPASQAGAVRQAAQEAGGHATLFRVSQSGGEADKAVGVFHAPQHAIADIGQRLRVQLDAAGVFATQRM